MERFIFTWKAAFTEKRQNKESLPSTGHSPNDHSCQSIASQISQMGESCYGLETSFAAFPGCKVQAGSECNSQHLKGYLPGMSEPQCGSLGLLHHRPGPSNKFIFKVVQLFFNLKLPLLALLFLSLLYNVCVFHIMECLLSTRL